MKLDSNEHNIFQGEEKDDVNLVDKLHKKFSSNKITHKADDNFNLHIEMSQMNLNNPEDFYASMFNNVLEQENLHLNERLDEILNMIPEEELQSGMESP